MTPGDRIRINGVEAVIEKVEPCGYCNRYVHFRLPDGTIAHQLECDMQVERPKPHLACENGVDVRCVERPCDVEV